MKTTPLFLVFVCLVFTLCPGYGQQVIGAFDLGDDGWSFHKQNAQGSAAVPHADARSGFGSLQLNGDFSSWTGGVSNVLVQRSISGTSTENQLSFWVKTSQLSYVLVRTVETSGEVHQHEVVLDTSGEWQLVILNNFEASVHWGGDDNGEWDGPLTTVAILFEAPALTGGHDMASLLIDEVTIADASTPAPSTFTLPLGLFEDGMDGWWVFRDKEGLVDVAVDTSVAQEGAGSLRVPADFSGGRTWQSLIKLIDAPLQVSGLGFYVRTENMDAIGVSILSNQGQNYSSTVTVTTPGQWQWVDLSNLPIDNATVAENDSKLFGADLAIRISAAPGHLIDSGQPGTFWLDDVQATAVGHGPVYLPTSAAHGDGPVTLRFDYSRAVPIFWGAADPPTSVTATFINDDTVARALPEIRLLDHRGDVLATLHAGGGQVDPGHSWSQELPLNLAGFGQYTVEATLGGPPNNTLSAKLAWIAEKAVPDPNSPIGVQLHLAQGPWGKHQTLGRARDAIQMAADLGASWIRDDMNPEFDAANQVIVTNPGWFTLRAPLLQSAGITPMLTFSRRIDGPPDTAAERSAYAERFASLIQQYGNFCRVFEVWNEPNISPGWGDTPDAAAYALLLEGAYTAAQIADPTVTVLGGSCSGTDFGFLETVFGQGAIMDGVSIHPYHGTAPEWVNTYPDKPATTVTFPSQMTFVDRIDAVDVLASSLGRTNLPIWATEMGYESVTAGQQWQTAYWLIRQHLLGMTDARLVRQFVYNLQNQGYVHDALSGMTFGLLRADGTPKPHAVAMNTLARLLRGKAFVASYGSDPDVVTLEFASAEETVLAVWAVGGSAEVELAVPGDGVEVVDLMGNTAVVPAAQGTVTLTVNDEPVFVRLDDDGQGGGSPTTYSLTIHGGSGSGAFQAGAIVPITAAQPPVGQVFDAWTGDTAYVADPAAAATSVTMPAQAVSVTATYTPVSTNQPPTVALTGPADEASFEEGETVVVSAEAGDPDSNLDRVEFLIDGVVAHTDTSAPYSYTLPALTAGAYDVQAVAVDAEGLQVASAIHTFEVTAIAPPSGGTIAINFQPASAAVPSGYLEDWGDLYRLKSNGETYGWSDWNSGGMRDREVDTDQRYDTLAMLGSKTWEIELPNGDYDVHIVCSDGAYPVEHAFDLEGTVVTDPDGVDSSDAHDLTVTVSDGRLTLQAAPSGSARIAFIEITPAVAPPPPPAEPAIAINFQPASADLPAGYLLDWGDLYSLKSNGETYGWSDWNSGGMRDREVDTDQRYDTLAMLGTKTWEVALPNGTYSVLIACGDKAYPVEHSFDLEGTVVADPDGVDDYDEHSLTVTVADGALTLQAAPAGSARVLFIEIIPLP